MKKHGTNLIYWVILAALGIFLIIGHNVALNIVCKVIGVALLLAAVSGVYSWWKTKSRKPEAIARLIGSLAFFGLGLWILLATGDFISFINVALGFVIILSAALTLYRGIKAGLHLPTIILAVIGIALGLIIACTNAATTWLVYCEGLGLMDLRASNLLSQTISASMRIHFPLAMPQVSTFGFSIIWAKTFFLLLVGMYSFPSNS